MHAVPAVCGMFVLVMHMWRYKPFLVSFIVSEVVQYLFDRMVQIHFKLSTTARDGIKCFRHRMWHEIPTHMHQITSWKAALQH